MFQSWNNKHTKVLFRTHKNFTRNKSVVQKLEKKKKRMLFQRWNRKTKKCCSNDGTTKPKSVVPKMEHQNQKVLFQRWNSKNKKCCSEDGTTKIGRERKIILFTVFYFLEKELNFYKDEAAEGLSSAAKICMVEFLCIC